MTGPDAVGVAVEAVRSGRMVIVVDRTDDSGTGNLVLAAGHIRADAVNFMATAGRGLIRVAMSAARLDALGIPPADPTATGPARDTFRVSVDLATGTAPGISARSRADTIRALTDPAGTARDFARPGHIFPIGCGEGGVLAVAAHPEAAVELVVSAGLDPAAVLCEICGGDGELARLPELLELGRAHDIPVVTIADLIDYRRRELCRVRRAGEARIPLEAGQFRAIGYVDGTGREHIALVCGEPTAVEAPLIRVQSECLLGDVFGSRRCDCRDTLRQSLARIAEAGSGAVVYVRGPDDVVSRTPATCPRAACDPSQRNALVHTDLRSACDILADLGVRAIRLLVDTADAAELPDDIRVVERIELTAQNSFARAGGARGPARRRQGYGVAAADRVRSAI